MGGPTPRRLVGVLYVQSGVRCNGGGRVVDVLLGRLTKWMQSRWARSHFQPGGLTTRLAGRIQRLPGGRIALAA